MITNNKAYKNRKRFSEKKKSLSFAYRSKLIKKKKNKRKNIMVIDK